MIKKLCSRWSYDRERMYNINLKFVLIEVFNINMVETKNNLVSLRTQKYERNVKTLTTN